MIHTHELRNQIGILKELFLKRAQKRIEMVDEIGKTLQMGTYSGDLDNWRSVQERSRNCLEMIAKETEMDCEYHNKICIISYGICTSSFPDTFEHFRKFLDEIEEIFRRSPADDSGENKVLNASTDSEKEND
jgi:hypothetical protein